jgi:hypothetical protein
MPLGRKNKEGLELDGTRRLLVYAVDVNLLGKDLNSIKKNTETVNENQYVSLDCISTYHTGLFSQENIPQSKKVMS